MKKNNVFLLFFYILIQCTWGLGQTLAGLVVFLINIKCPHHFYHGCVETQWQKKWSGMSLGLFIFTPVEQDNEVRVHEYGHTIQSLILGPFYLIPGIISLAWGNLPVYEKKRREMKLPYTACFVEAGASRLGEKVIGEKAIW